MTSRDRITASTVVAVDPATAFEIFTSELGLWWRRGPRHRFGTRAGGALHLEPGVGGRLIEGGIGGDEIARITVWEPATRLVLSWLGVDLAPAPPTEVEVRFEPAAGGTRVTIEHRGWDRLPAGHPMRPGVDSGAYLDAVGLCWADRLVELAATARRTSA